MSIRRSLTVASASLAAASLIGSCTSEPSDAATSPDEQIVIGETSQALHINYGSWSPTITITDALAIHAALVPTSTWQTTSDSRVFYFGGSQHDPQLPFGKNSWRLFNPATNAITTLNFNVNDAFCSGHAHMKDGKLVIVSGNEFYAGNSGFVGEIPTNTAPTVNCFGTTMNVHKCAGHFTGTKSTYLFDFTNNTLSASGNLARGRWYPSVIHMRGGGGYQLGAFSGHISAADAPAPPGDHDNWTIERITSATSGWALASGQSLGFTSLYPRGHLVPWNGGAIVFNSAWNNGPATLALLENSSGTMVGVPITTPPAAYQGFDTSSVLMPLRPNGSTYPPGRIMMTGAITYYMLDLANSSAGWQPTSARPAPVAGGSPRMRMHSIATILSTGDIFVSGGYEDPPTESTAVKYTEIYREDQNLWHEAAAAKIGRNYHSTQLLLPDGRVWTAGGNKRAGYAQTNQPNGDGRELQIEIFQPWYFSVSRPTIASGAGLAQPPSSGSWTIATGTGTTGTSITRVALMAPGSVTHAFNNDQRYVQLPITASTSSSVTVSVPSDPAVLPRGMYLLIISRSSNGNSAGAHVPSVGRWVRVN